MKGEAAEPRAIDYARFKKATSGMTTRDLIRNAWRNIAGERYDSAAAFYSVAAARYSPSLPEEDIRRCAIACVNLGYIWHAWRMDAVEAYPWLMKAREIASIHHIDEIETAVISNLGQIYFDYDNREKAVEYLREAFFRINDQKDDWYYWRSMMDYVAAAMFAGRDDLVDETVRTVGEYKFGPDAPMVPYVKKVREALASGISGNPAAGAEKMGEALTLFEVSTDSKRYRTLHAFIEGELWMKAGNPQLAASCFKRAIGISVAEGYANLTERAYAALAGCFKASGDNDSIQYYHHASLSIRDSLFNARRYEDVKNLETAGQISSLQQSVREATREADYARQRTIWLLAGDSVLLIALLLLYLSHRRLGAAYREIYKRNIELSRSSAGVRKADDSEATDATPEEEELLKKAISVFEGDDEIYNADFSIERLSELVGGHPKNVSRIINRLTGKNFNTLLGEYRVKKACLIFSDTDKLRTMTVEGVAESVGYRSRTYFSKIFKDFTGLTPSQFIRQAKENKV